MTSHCFVRNVLAYSIVTKGGVDPAEFRGFFDHGVYIPFLVTSALIAIIFVRIDQGNISTGFRQNRRNTEPYAPGSTGYKGFFAVKA
jgi:hypothetical protein